MNEGDLHALIEKWEALADDAREQARFLNPNDFARQGFFQALQKTYRAAAQDLRDLLAGEAEPLPAPEEYLAVAEEEASAVLQQAGLFARSLTLHADRVFTAVFSRLQPITQENRIRQLSAVDARIVIVDQGTLRDSGDPYVDFAFRQLH
jgi:hypothetical protein